MHKQTLDLSLLRKEFPALQETDGRGRPYVYFDGPFSMPHHLKKLSSGRI